MSLSFTLGPVSSLGHSRTHNRPGVLWSWLLCPGVLWARELARLSFPRAGLVPGSNSSLVLPTTNPHPLDHFDHIRAVIGSEFIGISGNYDGSGRFPQGLEDVSTYPVLIEELLRRGWREEELQGVLRGNLLRVFRQVEQVREESSGQSPREDEFPNRQMGRSCHSHLPTQPQSEHLVSHPEMNKWPANQALQRPSKASPHFILGLVAAATFSVLVLWP